MKKKLSLVLALVMCLGALTVAAHAAVRERIEGSKLIAEVSQDSGFAFTIMTDYYIGETTGTLTYDMETFEFSALEDGDTRTYSVFLLPDDNAVLEDEVTIRNLPSGGDPHYITPGMVYLSDEPSYEYLVIMPLFAWGEYKETSDGTWVPLPIEKGQDKVTLALGDYPEYALDDGKGNILESYRATDGKKVAFSDPAAPIGIPYYIYYEYGSINDYYHLLSTRLVLTPSVADEILATGGHTEDGIFYPILDYFPEVEQMILDARAKEQTPPAPQEAVAAPTSSTVKVNGQEVAFDAYIINENNYFKLRDLAYILNGTGKQFGVSWEAATDTVLLTSGAAYLPVGGEMQGKGAGDKAAQLTTSRIMLDGVEVELTVYLIEGNNYFKLRDVGAAIDFGVDWEAATNTVIIDTAKGYTP